MIEPGRAAGNRLVVADASLVRTPVDVRLPSTAEASVAVRAWGDDWIRRVAALPGAADLSHLGGVALWDATHLGVLAGLSPWMREAWRIARVIRLHRPSELVLVLGRSESGIREEACQFMARAMGVPCTVEVGEARVANARAGRLARIGQRVRDGLSRRLDAVMPLASLQRSFVNKQRPRVIFAEFFANNINALYPVYEELVADGRFEVTWMALRQEVTSRLREIGVNAFGIHQTGAVPIWRAARTRAAAVRGAVDRLEDEPEFRRTFAFEGVDVYAALWPRLRPTVEMTNAVASRMIIAAQRALAAAAPDVLVVGNDASLSCRAFVLAARAMRLRTVYVQHGHVPRDQEVLPGASDTLLIWGESSRRAFLGLGNRAEQLVVVGATQYDRLFRRGESEPSGLSGTTTGDGKSARKTVVYTSAPASRGETDADYVLASTTVAETAAVLRDVRFIIKLHPTEEASLWRRLRSATHGAFEVVKDCDTIELLHSADLVMTRFSTTGMEAIILGKPLVTINLTDAPDRAPYAEAGAALPVRLAAELAPTVRRGLSDPDVDAALAPHRAAFLGDTFGDRAGGAAKAAAAAIARMVSERNSVTGAMETVTAH